MRTFSVQDNPTGKKKFMICPPMIAVVASSVFISFAATAMVNTSKKRG